MKISILILYSLLVFSCAVHNPTNEVLEENSESEDILFNATIINDEIFIPQNLEEAHMELDRGLTERAKELMRKGFDELTEEEQFSYSFSLGHHGLGMWVRNNWNLWKGGKLSEYFNEMGIYHPDDMSGIIFDSYIAKLRGEEYSLKKDIEYYQEYWKSMETPKESSPNDGAEIAWVITIGEGKGTIHLGISKSDNSFWRYEYGSGKGIEPAKPNEVKDLKEVIKRWEDIGSTPAYIKNKS